MARPVVLEHRQVHYAHANELGQAGKGHPALLEELIEPATGPGVGVAHQTRLPV